MKNLIIVLFLILPTLTFSQTRKEARQQRKLERKFIQLQRENANEWNLYEIDLSNFYDIYNSGNVSEYYLDWQNTPKSEDFWPELFQDKGTILNLFEQKDGVLRYTESIYIENTKPQFWEIEYQKMYNDMLIDMDFEY
jgi:hypothetical protein